MVGSLDTYIRRPPFVSSAQMRVEHSTLGQLGSLQLLQLRYSSIHTADSGDTTPWSRMVKLKDRTSSRLPVLRPVFESLQTVHFITSPLYLCSL